RSDAAAVTRGHDVIRESHTQRQTTLLVRGQNHVYDSCWELHEVDLEEIVLAYLGHGTTYDRRRGSLREAVAG
ncbi:MAG: ABC transporter ATP-binding protein, partial [Gaiellaceae bacterium]